MHWTILKNIIITGITIKIFNNKFKWNISKTQINKINKIIKIKNAEVMATTNFRNGILAFVTLSL